jgi:hypothetical protein
MRIIILVAAIVGLCACSTADWSPNAYWTRPEATLTVLAGESEACYRSALDPEMPSAFPGTSPENPVLPRTTPPPKLWELAPRQVAFEHFEEQLKYERCMRLRGWESRRLTTPTL